MHQIEPAQVQKTRTKESSEVLDPSSASQRVGNAEKELPIV
jgi:hypothetical protein